MTHTSSDHDEHREGLAHDLPTMQRKGMVRRPWGRRGLLGLGLGLGAASLVGCASEDGSSGTSAAGRSGGQPPAGGPGGVSQSNVDDGDIPEETGGPYPADGSNGQNVLTRSGIVRRDIRSSFGDATGTADGVPLTIRLKVLDHDADGSTPFAGAAVYLWQCDREGRYSLYSDGITEENYLRGVQEVADDGTVEFLSIFPACYDGRWPHLHFEVYESLDEATRAGTKLRTSQIAFPEDACRQVYDNADGYDASRHTFERVSLDSDLVFADGHRLQLARLNGSADRGYDLRLSVPV